MEAAGKTKCTGNTDCVRMYVYQQDWMPGFAAFRNDGSIAKGTAHIALDLAAFLSLIDDASVKVSELPYLIAESLMHEVIHVFEAWAGVEFSEERVESLLDKYRSSIGREIRESEESAPTVPAEAMNTLAHIASEWQSRAERAEEECARLKGFCDEFVWGENNPLEYDTLHARHATLQAEHQALREAAVLAEHKIDQCMNFGQDDPKRIRLGVALHALRAALKQQADGSVRRG